jgi:acyl-coenzyme A thioesterase PaaI-like protein
VGPMKRDYFYEVDKRGGVTLNGQLQDDPWFLDVLYRRLAPSANTQMLGYPYVSRCGDEMNYLKAEDTPVVFTWFDGRRLGYAGTLSLPFNAEHLSFSSDGVLYHAAPVGVRGRCSPNVAVEISQAIVPWGPWYALQDEDGFEHVIAPSSPEDSYRLLRPRTENHCIGCGAGNPSSLKLSFLHDLRNSTVNTWLSPSHRLQGAMGTVHGGMVSLLLDEIMGKALSVQSIKAPTAKIEVNFRRPMHIGMRYHCWSLLEGTHGRKHDVRGAIVNQQGEVIADGRGLFVSPRKGSDE